MTSIVILHPSFHKPTHLVMELLCEPNVGWLKYLSIVIDFINFEWTKDAVFVAIHGMLVCFGFLGLPQGTNEKMGFTLS